MAPKVAPSANFQNPVGLVLRMLRSGHRAAYAALVHEGMRLFAKPFSVFFAARERRMLAASDDQRLPVVLIVGAPRSGTTLVYQVLARYLDVTYFSNLTSLFPKVPLAASWLLRRFASSQTADFQNFYGQTAGLSGPNDGFVIWNRWLGEDRYVPRQALTGVEQVDMARFFGAWCAQFGKPFLNKNNRNTACLDLLARSLPQSYFVVVRRNPVLVAQSLINAREQVQGDKAVGWGLHSQSSDTEADPLAYVDDVCDQVIHIEAQLDEQLAHVPTDRIIEISYEDFCLQPHEALAQIVERVPRLTRHEALVASELKPFRVSTGVTLSAAEHERLRQRFQQAGKVAVG